jgi:hypothetical protein
MQATFWNMPGFAQCVRATLVAFALASCVALGQSQPKSPVGTTWDCVVSGARNGVAYITFSDDGTFTGYQVLVPTPPPSPRPALVSVAVPGNGLGPKPGLPSATNRMQFLGAWPVKGIWGFDSKGRVIGSFLEVAYSSACATTTVPVSTNLFDSLEPITQTNVFPVTFSLTFPLSTNKAAGTVKNQTITYFDQVPVRTNFFDAPNPILETNVLVSGVAVTLPIAVTPASITYSNQVTCYLPLVPLATNTFSSSLPYWATNHLPSGAFCVTLPIYTNLDLITFAERMTRYRDHVSVNSSTFTNTTALTQTNYLADGTYCETIPLHPNILETYTERTTCYLNPVPLSTNTFESPIWIAEMRNLSDGTACVTFPIATNMAPGSFVEQLTIYSAEHLAISTNVFDSSAMIMETNYLPDGSFAVTIPLSTNLVTSTFVEQMLCFTGAVPVSVSNFTNAAPYSQINVNPDGAFCITVPVFTNVTLMGFTEQTTCYTNHVPLQDQGNPSTFVSSTAFTSTNYLPDGTYCETVVSATNTFVGSFTEQMTCYLEPVIIGSNTSLAMVPINQTETFPDGSFCVTQPVSTNTVGGAYKMQTVWYLPQHECPPVFTNSVHFLGTVVPGKRLTLVGKSSLGGATYRGVPAVTLPDISGSWLGLRHQNRLLSYEFFDLTDSPYAPNSYTVSGHGAGCSYTGLALLSSQKKIALACDIVVGTNYQSTRAVIGSFNPRKASASVAGVEAPSGALSSTNRLSLQLSRRTSQP